MWNAAWRAASRDDVGENSLNNSSRRIWTSAPGRRELLAAAYPPKNHRKKLAPPRRCRRGSALEGCASTDEHFLLAQIHARRCDATSYSLEALGVGYFIQTNNLLETLARPAILLLSDISQNRRSFCEDLAKTWLRPGAVLFFLCDMLAKAWRSSCEGRAMILGSSSASLISTDPGRRDDLEKEDCGVGVGVIRHQPLIRAAV